MKNGIVVIGNVFVDIKGFPFNNYIPAGRNAGNVEFVHGGVGRNVAEDIANLELRPTFLSMVDTTAQGEEVIKKLSNHKVNTRYMITSPDGMGIWLAIFDETGDVDVHRATLYTRGILAVEATMGLRDGLFEGQPLVDLLVQGLDAHFRTEFRHLYSGNRHAVLGCPGERFYRSYLGLTLALTVG